MGDMKEAARSAMAAQLLSSVISDEHKLFKASLIADMADLGAERLGVKNDDGDELGAIILAGGKPKAQVVDDRAFLAWVADRYPQEIVQAVRESFAKKVLAEATAAGDPVDVHSGEVIPGVEIRPGEPYLTCRPTPEAKQRMRDTLMASGLLRLPAGGGQE